MKVVIEQETDELEVKGKYLIIRNCGFRSFVKRPIFILHSFTKTGKTLELKTLNWQICLRNGRLGTEDGRR